MFSANEEVDDVEYDKHEAEPRVDTPTHIVKIFAEHRANNRGGRKDYFSAERTN